MKWFETSVDLENERALADAMTRPWNVQAVKVPAAMQVDYALLRDGQLKAWVEIKCRSTRMRAYPDYLISLSKVEAGMSLADAYNVPFLLAVRWADGAGWIQPSITDVRHDGANDRHGISRPEPVVHLPLDKFHKINL